MFYEDRCSGLGVAYTLEVEAAIKRILDAPNRWRTIEEDVRRCLIHTFPFGILYTVEQDSILIIAVMNLRREPGYWRSRLSRPNT